MSSINFFVKMRLFLALFFFSFCLAKEPIIVNHDDVEGFYLNGNLIKGISTASLGSKEFEIWRSNMAAGSCTPPHTHETEEVFIFLKGKGKVLIKGKETHFQAPCTVICPAGVKHQFFNTGSEETDAIVILGLHSKIFNIQGNVMKLPWRE